MSKGFTTLYRSGYPLSLEISVLSKITDYKKKSLLGKAWVVVPNNYVGAHLRHKLALNNAHLNISFVTLTALAEHLLSNHKQFLSRKKLLPEMELLEISNLAQKKLKDTEFEESSKKTGFHKNLRNFFRHLISEEADHIPAINSKTKFFEEIYGNYRSLRNKYHHDLWNIELASKSALNISDPVFVYGFTHFSRLERSFLSQIAASTSLSTWIEIAAVENFQIPTLTWLDHQYKDVVDLEEQPASSQMSIQACNHIEDESMWIAHTIAGAQKKSTIPFHQFGIFLNDYEGQKSYIETALQQLNIPFVSLHGQKLSEGRLGQSLIMLVNLLGTNWSRNQWFDFLQTFPFDEFFYSENGTPADWSSFSVDAGISSKNAFFFERFDILAAKNKHPKVLAFTAFQRKMLNEISMIESIIETGKFLSLSQALNTFVQTYAKQTSLTGCVLQLFDELTYICKNTDASWIEIKDMILEKISLSVESRKVFESEGVLIAPFSMLNGLFFESIFLPHMNERFFPKHDSAQFDLHVDELKQLSENAKISFDHTQKEFDMQSSMLDSAKFHANQHVYISYSDYSLPKEEDLKPSILIQPWMNESNMHRPSFDTDGSASSPETFQQIRSWIDSEQSHEWTKFNALADSKYIHKEIYSVTELSRYAECPKRYFLANVLGLSAEEYLEEHVQMMPKDKGTLIHEILFRFFMAMKQQGYIPLKKENRGNMIELLSVIASETFKQYQAVNAYGIPDLWKIDEKELLSDLNAYLDQEIVDASYWIPYSFEYRFGMSKFAGQEDDPHSTESPISLDVAGKKFQFKGRVDRIDVSADGNSMRIIDYKTGKLFDRQAWSYENGTKLQLPIYLLLSDQFFEKKPSHVEGKLVSLQAISKFDERKVTKDEILSKQTELMEHLTLLDRGIKDGIFFPNPEKGENCKFCDFLTLCGKNMHQTVENVESTPFMQKYQELKKKLS